MKTLNELTIEASKRVHLYDNQAKTFIDGGDITSDQLKEAISNGYLHEVVPILRNQNPLFFDQKATLSNYSDLFVPNSVGGDLDVLYSYLPFFHSGSIGDVIYNTVQNEYAKIIGNPNNDPRGAQVEKEIANWGDDLMALIPKYLPLKGDLVDLSVIREVLIRYDPSQLEYVKALPITEQELHRRGIESFENYNGSIADPRYIQTSVKIADQLVNAIRFFPQFNTRDDQAIILTYTEQPAFSENTDEPRMPVGHENFLQWYGVKEAALIRENYNLVKYADKQIEEGKALLLSSYTPLVSDGPLLIKTQPHLAKIFNRSI